MSYDGSIMLAIPGGEDHELMELGNMTSNLGPMWREALTRAVGKPLRLSDTSGWRCIDAAPVLAKAVEVMRDNEAELRQLDPPNGWGSYDQALAYLILARDRCEQFAHVDGAFLRWDV